MPTINAYVDGYLAPLVTVERETRAAAEVDQLGTFPDAWRSRLVVLRAYILTCIESQKSVDDLFTAKLASYRKEWAEQLPLARAAQQAVDADAGTSKAGGYFSIPLERA